jgi:hypothetical protein
MSIKGTAGIALSINVFCGELDLKVFEGESVE